MKLILLLVISCLALHNGQGAPANARYMFVTCNPEGSNANCVTRQTPEMAWTPDLLAKLPASSAKNLETELVEDEHPQREMEEVDKEEPPMISDEGELPLMYQPEDGSGYEGSGFEGTYQADQGFVMIENETGSGDRNENKGQNKRFSRSRSLADEAKPEEQELKEDHLLQL